jgi:pantoate--beta-alanine ligase
VHILEFFALFLAYFHDISFLFGKNVVILHSEMKVFSKIVDLQNQLFEDRKQGKTVGLVPTMGALHEGHASLVKRSVKENQVTVVSVFVNPTQFNDKNDLKNYPRTLEADCKLLEATFDAETGNQKSANSKSLYVLAPSVEEMYPTPDTRQFEYPPVSTVMEGAHRPGHFNGVCQVVSRLFYIVKPDRSYFGEKDWQQIAVIKAMVRHLGIPGEIVECEIVRDKDGLAKSSRNTLLSPDERAIAPAIYKALKASVTYAKKHSLKETHDKVVADINAVEGLDVEYFSIVDGNTLLDIENWEDSDYVVGCITVYCGKTPIRLIDHIKYKN